MVKPQDVVNKIKEEKIEPRPRWEVLLKNYAYWGILGLMILFGAAVLSMTLLGLFDLRPGLHSGLPIGKYFRLLFVTMPLAWLVLGAAALVFGIMAFHKTKHGYRYRNLFIASVSVMALLMLALLAHLTNLARPIESVFDRSVPGGFRQIAPPKEGRFFQPEEGLIAGRIFQIGDDYFILMNHKDEEWKVILLDDTELIEIPQLEPGLRVFVSGDEISDKIFEAETVRPLVPPMMMQHGKNN